MARNTHDNKPISHCPRGQGGRTFSRCVHKCKPSSEHLPIRSKVQPYPMGNKKLKLGCYKYVPMGVELDKEGKPIDWP